MMIFLWLKSPLLDADSCGGVAWAYMGGGQRSGIHSYARDCSGVPSAIYLSVQTLADFSHLKILATIRL